MAILNRRASGIWIINGGKRALPFDKVQVVLNRKGKGIAFGVIVEDLKGQRDRSRSGQRFDKKFSNNLLASKDCIRLKRGAKKLKVLAGEQSHLYICRGTAPVVGNQQPDANGIFKMSLVGLQFTDQFSVPAQLIALDM